VDLDSSVVAFDRDGRVVDAAWYRQLEALGRVLRHKGDNRTGVRFIAKTLLSFIRKERVMTKKSKLI
jgi:hypothetical protein